MDRDASIPSQRPGLWPSWLVGLLLICGFSATSCDDWYDDCYCDHYCSCYDHCHCGDCGCGHHHHHHHHHYYYYSRIHEPAGDDHPYQLKDFELVVSTTPNHHPVAALLQIKGVDLYHPEGPANAGDGSYEELTRILIQTNPDLLGLPDGAGRLSFDRVDYEVDGFCVLFRQETEGVSGTFSVVEGAYLEFCFRTEGDLLEIRNSTWVVPPR